MSWSICHTGCDCPRLYSAQSWKVILLWALYTAWAHGRQCHHERTKMLFHRIANSGLRCAFQTLYAVSCFLSILEKILLWIPCLGQTWDWIDWEHCHACRPEKVWQGHGKQGQALFYRIAQSWYTVSVLLNMSISIQPQYLYSIYAPWCAMHFPLLIALEKIFSCQYSQ